MPDELFRRRTDQDAGDLTPLRALVVDDHERYRNHIAKLAFDAGFAVTACADGAEALAALVQNADYQLLIIDREMPRVNGFALISAVREQKRFKDVYAVMLSAREDTETKVSALSLGFDDGGRMYATAGRCVHARLPRQPLLRLRIVQSRSASATTASSTRASP